MDVVWARDLAYSLLAEPLPRRWFHSQGVATQAELLTPIVGEDAALLQAAAWLHDIGYSPDIAKTRFHPLDGARYLRDNQKADNRLCCLVAHHSCALIEAELRGLERELCKEFTLEPGIITDALIYCDMTVGPQGNLVTVGERLAEIRHRYGPNHLVTLFIDRAESDIYSATGRIEARKATFPHR